MNKQIGKITTKISKILDLGYKDMADEKVKKYFKHKYFYKF